MNLKLSSLGDGARQNRKYTIVQNTERAKLFSSDLLFL